ncbi:hypothetical protein E4U61_005910 [Claviceps capensis]|nr:hypothetical protein E4U61_005910 [Claviceps capensis]
MGVSPTVTSGAGNAIASKDFFCPSSIGNLELPDGQFAQHFKLRYVVYSMWIRSQTNKRSTYYLKKYQREDITIEKLREMFNQNSEEAQTLLKSITRYSGNMLGTRPYWLGKWNGLAAMFLPPSPRQHQTPGY